MLVHAVSGHEQIINIRSVWVTGGSRYEAYGLKHSAKANAPKGAQKVLTNKGLFWEWYVPVRYVPHVDRNKKYPAEKCRFLRSARGVGKRDR